MTPVLLKKNRQTRGIANLLWWILPCVFFVGIAFSLSVSFAAEPGSWNYFKKKFIQENGRVVDYVQQGISHSEGQGYAMLIAVQANDRETFDRLWNWTRNNLQVRSGDALMCWSWGKRPTGEWAVLDYNTATDGDICIAYALFMASEKWQADHFKNEAMNIIASIKSRLILHRYGKTIVLPGYFGFVNKDYLILNPSYWVFPAFLTFAGYQDKVLWQTVHDDAITLIRENTFSDLNLPPDWLLLSKTGSDFFSKRSTLCGYEAIRIFLFLSWCNNLAQLPGITRLIDRIDAIGFVPMPFDLDRNTMSIWGGPAGFYAVMARCADSLGKIQSAAWLWKEAENRLKKESDNYYSHILYLLACQEISS